MTRALTDRRGPIVVAVVTALIAVSTVLSPPAARAASFSGSLAAAVAALPVAAESNSGYDRALFPHWIDADRDCQSARAEVLISEAVPGTPLTFTSSGNCTVATGRWSSYYDRATWTAAADVDIDHLVPLAEAWGSGARTWTTARRQAFANDLADPRTLVAVTDSVNQAKGDQDPATWLPTYDRCRYVAEWVAVKLRWDLAVDPAERSVLQQYAGQCTVTVTVTGA
ncbi:HNH endonuclease family protein [Nocardioides sp.]|uniref:HNH endonuclease family protein n=1 Tax=Nocardioides sp. TaxID=35761 RepID=UPI0035197F85